MFLDESTVTTTSTPDQIELRTDVSAPFLVESVNRWHYTSKSASKLHVLVYTGAYLISGVGNLLVPLGQISMFKSKLGHTRLLCAMYTLRFFCGPRKFCCGPQKKIWAAGCRPLL